MTYRRTPAESVQTRTAFVPSLSDPDDRRTRARPRLRGSANPPGDRARGRRRNRQVSGGRRDPRTPERVAATRAEVAPEFDVRKTNVLNRFLPDTKTKTGNSSNSSVVDDDRQQRRVILMYDRVWPRGTGVIARYSAG